MGLDWCLKRKAVAGKEALLDNLLQQYETSEDKDTRDAISEEIEQICLNPFEVVGSPMIGRDAIALEWLRADYVANPELYMRLVVDETTGIRKEHKMSWDEVLAANNNKYVSELASDRDGLGDITGFAAPPTSFRGKVIGYCDTIIGAALAKKAYVDLTSEEMVVYAKQMKEAAQNSLKSLRGEEKARAEILLQQGSKCLEDSDYDLGLDRYADVSSACKWLTYWGTKGFSMWAWY